VRLRLIRTAYRLAWLLLWLLAPLRVGRGRGAKAILTNDGRVLLVLHTYGPRVWELPGGGLHRRESPRDGVRREIREELAVELDDAQLVELGLGRPRRPGRRISFFAAELASSAVTPDEREIAAAQWYRPDALPPRLGRHVAEQVRRLGRLSVPATVRSRPPDRAAGGAAEP
jgi:ADP-ribose pyrophosphatase YjhB (NUDIX family)